MSEFSSSFHLRSTEQQDAVDLLKRAGLEGAVFAPTNGWVTFITKDETCFQIETLAGLARHPLLAYDHAEDHCWFFKVFNDGVLVGEYDCTWEDVEELVITHPTFRLCGPLLAIKDGNLNLPQLLELLRVADVPAVKQALEPTYVTEYEHLWKDPPAYRFARSLGLAHYDWLSPSDLNNVKERDAACILVS